jgi:16S rRNA (cytosine967-C5)-methyltransferase
VSPRPARGRRGLDARAAAAHVLVRAEQEPGLHASDALSEALDSAPEADPRDRALATELVYGVLRQQRRLDHSLAPCVRQGMDALEPVARALLRVGAYQLFFLDRVPGPIAVSATQDAADRLRASRLKGLLNAVLRRVLRDGEALPPGDGDDAIGVRASLPTWIVRHLREAYGDADVAREALALRERPGLNVRPTLASGGAAAVRRDLSAAGFAVAEGAAGTLVISGPGDPFASASFRGGGFVPQDPASLAVVGLLGDVAGVDVLDLCAGRGIKSTALADRGARVVAVDVAGDKLDQAHALAARLGLGDRLRTVAGDPSRQRLALGGPPGGFSKVLVDAPCTGLGTLRRRPEIAWRTRPDDVARLGRLQADLVAAAAAQVAVGGELVYAVCTFTRIEAAPPLPLGFEPLGEPGLHRWRPSDGFDAFSARHWKRIS